MLRLPVERFSEFVPADHGGDYFVMDDQGEWHVAIWDGVQELFLDDTGPICVEFWAIAPPRAVVLNSLRGN